MITDLLIQHQFANANRSNISLKDFPSAAIVCRVDTDAFATTSESNESFGLQDSLDQASENQNASNSIAPVIEEWTPVLEAKFRRLAEAKAFKTLSLKGKVEFEKLVALRRQLKNPRTGEEVLVEYQQRMLTRKMVSVLTEYVNFHKLSHHTG